MKLIELSKTGKHADKYFAKVDDKNYEHLNQWNWHISLDKKGKIYARAWVRINGKLIPMEMHRMILGIVDKNYKGDHIDKDGLNNQEYNLRTATTLQNNAHCERLLGKSGYRGVILMKWSRGEQRYSARISVNCKTVVLGNFPTTPCGALQAALCYDDGAVKYHGDFAILNFPKP